MIFKAKNNKEEEVFLRREMAMLAEIVVNEYFERKLKKRSNILPGFNGRTGA